MAAPSNPLSPVLTPDGRYLFVTASGAKDPAFSYTISDPSIVTLTVQKRVTPQAKPRRICPIRKPGGPGAIPVQFSDVNSSARSFSTVKQTTKRARRRRSSPRASRCRAGKQTVKLSALLGGTKLKPGWYRVLINGKRADGSVSQFVTVKFWVLDTTKAKKRR